MLALTDLTLLVSLAMAVLLVTPFLGRYMAAHHGRGNGRS